MKKAWSSLRSSPCFWRLRTFPARRACRRRIGRRLDGWPNRDLNVGAIVAMAPDLKAFEDLLGADRATVDRVLHAWGPGKYDAELDQDGKGLRPDGKTAATLLPAAFGLAGVNLHTYNGWGSVPYWNAYVAVTQMHGKGTFFDPRIQNDPGQFPVGARAGFGNVRISPDLVSSKLAALHYYPAVDSGAQAPQGQLRRGGGRTGKARFRGKGEVRNLPRPPLFTEPGWSIHTGGGERNRQFPGEPVTGQEVLSDDPALGPLRPREGRLLPRWPFRRLPRRRRSLRPAYGSPAHGVREDRAHRISEVPLEDSFSR